MDAANRSASLPLVIAFGLCGLALWLAIRAPVLKTVG